MNDHIVLCRQITNELHIPKVSKCIRIDHERYAKLLFAGLSVPLPHIFWWGYHCNFTQKRMLDNFLSYFNTQGENFSSIFDGLSQIQFRKDQLSAWAIVIEYVLLHLIAVIKLSHFCLRTLIFRWPITILPKFFWRISLRLYIHQRTLKCCLTFTTVMKTIIIIISFS